MRGGRGGVGKRVVRDPYHPWKLKDQIIGPLAVYTQYQLVSNKTSASSSIAVTIQCIAVTV